MGTMVPCPQYFKSLLNNILDLQIIKESHLEFNTVFLQSQNVYLGTAEQIQLFPGLHS